MVDFPEGLGIEPHFSPLLHFFYSSVCETSRELGSEAVLRERLFYSSRGPEAASVLRGFGGGLDPKSHTLPLDGTYAWAKPLDAQLDK